MVNYFFPLTNSSNLKSHCIDIIFEWSKSPWFLLLKVFFLKRLLSTLLYSAPYNNIKLCHKIYCSMENTAFCSACSYFAKHLSLLYSFFTHILFKYMLFPRLLYYFVVKQWLLLHFIFNSCYYKSYNYNIVERISTNFYRFAFIS